MGEMNEMNYSRNNKEMGSNKEHHCQVKRSHFNETDEDETRHE